MVSRGFDVPQLPDDCILQIFRPRDGHAIRIWADGRWTEARGGAPDTAREPFDVTLQYREVRDRFVTEQTAAWSKALAEDIAAGPHVTDGAKKPGGGSVQLEPLHISARVDGVPRTVVMEADLTVPGSLGPLQAPWTHLRDRLWAPQR